MKRTDAEYDNFRSTRISAWRQFEAFGEREYARDMRRNYCCL